jgi:ubiquitin-conjugating enzyme E2 J1
MAANGANPTIKRLMNELRKFETDPDPNLTAAPIGDDLLLWHFTIRGPPGTAFEGGIYHGRIVFPQQYPMKPPDIYFMTPNGRFEVRKKLCLTITSYHPDSWNPAWDVRTALTSLIAFMPTKGEGAVGAIDASDQERKALALQSQSWHCPECDLQLAPLPCGEGETVAQEGEEAKEEGPAEETVGEGVSEETVVEEAAAEEGGVEEGDMLHINYDEMKVVALHKRDQFLPLFDIPIVTLFSLVLFLIANSQFHFVKLFGE